MSYELLRVNDGAWNRFLCKGDRFFVMTLGVFDDRDDAMIELIRRSNLLKTDGMMEGDCNVVDGKWKTPYGECVEGYFHFDYYTYMVMAEESEG